MVMSYYVHMPLSITHELTGITSQRSALSMLKTKTIRSYDLCLDICRIADRFPDQKNEIIQQLRYNAIGLLLSAARRHTKKKRLKPLMAAMRHTKRLSLLLSMCRDLNYINHEQFTEINLRLSRFSSTIKQMIFCNKRKRKSLF